MEKTYTTKDVCRMLGTTYYRIQYLLDTGKVKEIPQNSSGFRIYTDEIIEEIKEALSR